MRAEDHIRLLEDQLKRIEEVRLHPGWADLREIMQVEINQAVSQLCATARMPEDELHFRRGALWAAQKLVNLPENLELRLRNDLLVEKSMLATASTKPSATADTKE